MPTKIQVNATNYGVQTNATIPISQVICDPDHNPQRMFGTDLAIVASIAESIKRIGQKDAVHCRRDHEGKAVVYDGRHRFLAIRKLEDERLAAGGKVGDKEEYRITCSISNINEVDALLVGIETASQRNEYGPADQCHLINLLKESPYSLTEQEIASRLNINQSYVNQCSKLAVLDRNTMKRVNKRRGEKGHIPFSVAYRLTQVEESERKAILEEAGEDGKIDAKRVNEKVRSTNSTVTVGHSQKEVKELLEGFTGPAEHPLVAAMANAVLDFWKGDLGTEKGVRGRINKVTKELGWEPEDEASQTEVAAEAAPAGQA